MRNLFDKPARDELIERINKLTAESQPLWGKMNVYQMIRHCAQWESMLLGHVTYKQSLMGKIFGKIALKAMMKDEPLKPNLPTVPSFKITATGDAEAEKQKWLALIRQHDQNQPEGFVHPFFGKLTREQAGQMAYKHIDHHLRQFGV